MTKETTRQGEESPDVRKAIGRAIRILRERAGLSQEHAAERAGITAQYFGHVEKGKPKGLTHPEVQARYLRALDAKPEDLEAILNDLTGEDSQASRVARLAREIGGHPGPHGAPPQVRQAVFPTTDGDVIVTLPASLTPAGFKQLEDYLAIFIRSNTPANSH